MKTNVEIEIERIQKYVNNIPSEKRIVAYAYLWGVFQGTIKTLENPIMKMQLTPEMIFKAIKGIEDI